MLFVPVSIFNLQTFSKSETSCNLLGATSKKSGTFSVEPRVTYAHKATECWEVALLKIKSEKINQTIKAGGGGGGGYPGHTKKMSFLKYLSCILSQFFLKFPQLKFLETSIFFLPKFKKLNISLIYEVIIVQVL